MTADLIARLKKATGPDRELDIAIWFAVDGRAADKTLAWLVGGAVERAPTYTASVDAALSIVPEGAEWQVGSATLLDKYWASVITPKQEHNANAPTPALALWIAALEARENKG